MAELTDEDFDGGSGTLIHTSNNAVGATGLRIFGNGSMLALTYDSPWMHYTFDDQLCFSTKKDTRGRAQTFFVQRNGEPKVQVDEAEWCHQFDEARTLPRRV